MKTFPLDSPQNIPGVYALRNLTVKRLYVGQTTDLLRRVTEWRAVARGGSGSGFALVRDELQGTPIADWEFLVVKEMPGATSVELRKAEAEITEYLRGKFEGAVANAELPPPEVAPNAKGMMSIARSTVTYQGKPISYSEARVLLNTQKAKTLHKRLAKYRAKGVTTVSVEQLLTSGVGSGARR